jgi:uncharacterized protein (DUF2384 family)
MYSPYSRRQEHRQRLSDNVARRVAKDARCPQIKLQDAIAFIHRDDRIVREVDDIGEARRSPC